jgi:hypothetical protein
MSRTSARSGSTEGYKYGNLTRKLEWVTVFSLDNWAGFDVVTDPTLTRLRLNGINPNLYISISAGISLVGSNKVPAYPALPGTLKVTPYQLADSGEVLYLKDLTIAPATLPACYTLGPGLGLASTADNPNFGAQLADAALIEVDIDPAQYTLFNVGGPAKIVVAVEATYNGQWWDTDTIEYLLGKLALQGTNSQFVITTGL